MLISDLTKMDNNMLISDLTKMDNNVSISDLTKMDNNMSISHLTKMDNNMSISDLTKMDNNMSISYLTKMDNNIPCVNVFIVIFLHIILANVTEITIIEQKKINLSPKNILTIFPHKQKAYPCIYPF